MKVDLVCTVVFNLHQINRRPSFFWDTRYLQGSSYEECVRNVIDTTISFDNLGFTIHPEKSSFIPKQVITHLGFILNSKETTVRPTTEKASNVASFCKSLLCWFHGPRIVSAASTVVF